MGINICVLAEYEFDIDHIRSQYYTMPRLYSGITILKRNKRLAN